LLYTCLLSIVTMCSKCRGVSTSLCNGIESTSSTFLSHELISEKSYLKESHSQC
jgi:hypothetical protein